MLRPLSRWATTPLPPAPPGSRKLRPFVWLVLLGGVALYLYLRVPDQPPPVAPAPSPGPSGSLQLCFWNVENLFDDVDDDQLDQPDRDYDDWFARDTATRRLKYRHLSEALLALNDGRGPDILALAEVESLRAVELLRDALNERLPDPTLHYTDTLFRDPRGGRTIATAFLARPPVRASRAQLLGRRQRILEGRFQLGDHELIVVAAHWTSRVTDKDGSSRGRYADAIHGRYRSAVQSNPKVDFLVCGDFNDTPDDPSVVRHLRASGDAARVCRDPEAALLFNLLANKDPAHYGTLYYHGWLIFDQICVSPGLLDRDGWWCAPETVRVVNTLVQPGERIRRPWPFGGKGQSGPRGWSNHFPVTLQLHVAGPP